MKLGGHGRVFYITQAIGSTLFLVFATQLIWILPSMVPCFILFWVGLELLLWGLWQVRPAGFCRSSRCTAKEQFNPLEYTQVIAMVIVSLDPVGIFDRDASMAALDPSGTVTFVATILVGALLSLVNVVRLIGLVDPVITEVDLATLRSDVVRPRSDSAILGSLGKQVLVIRVAKTVLTVHNAGRLEDRVDTAVASRNQELFEAGSDRGVLAVLLDFELVVGFSVDAAQMLLGLLASTATHDYRLIVCGITAKSFDVLHAFGAPLRMAVLTEEHVAGVPTPAGLILCSDQSLDRTLEVCERTLLYGTFNGAVTSSGQPEYQAIVESACKDIDDRQLLPLLVDIYTAVR